MIQALSSVQQTALFSELLCIAFASGSSQHKIKYCSQLLYHAVDCCVDWELIGGTSHTRNRSSINVFLAILCLPATLRMTTSICRQQQNKIISAGPKQKCCI